MTAAPPLRLHARVSISNLGYGEVLFVGQTSFAPGVWVGIQLDTQAGKNDGSVKGKRYFDCEDGWGVFVRPSQVQVLPPGHETRPVDLGDQDLDDNVDSPSPQLPASRPGIRTAQTSTVPSTPVSGLSPRKMGAPPTRPASGASVSSVSSTASRSVATPSAASLAARRVISPSKQATTTRSSVKPSTARPSMSSSSAQPTTPALGASRLQKSTPAATRTTATPATAPRVAPRTTVAAPTPTARAGLRPVARARPSMAPSPAQSSSPSVSAATRLSAARPGASNLSASAPISRTGSASSTGRVLPRAGSSLAPARVHGQRSSASSAASSARTTPSHHYAEDEDVMTDHHGSDAEEQGPVAIDEALLDENDDQEADVTISASPSGLKSTKLVNQSTRDFMSLMPSSSSTNMRTSTEFGALQRELEELRATVRVLEKKRDDDRLRIVELEKVKQEAETAITAAPKLTSKVHALQAELKDQKKLEKDWSLQKDEFERQLARLNDELESLTLDREMAEEQAETAVLEAQEHLTALEKANAKVAALQVLPRSTDSQDAKEVESGDQSDGAIFAVRSENDQLRRVLRDLRDRSNEAESEHRRKLTELERENAELIELNSTNDSLLPELETAESIIEDLKLQLDDALGAQDLVEQLTERNLQMGDLVQKLRGEMEELETIAEINNELEEQHTINERELREEVDTYEARLRDVQLRNDGLENNATDYLNTFAQFRELVSNLQSELESARADQAAISGDAGANRKDVADQAILNLNLRLQSTALKRQAKTLDLELGKLQASQAMSHLEMVRPYLPNAYFEADADAVHCLLFFQRMAVKSDLIKSVVEDSHDIQESLSGVVPETLVGICQMRHSIAHFSALSRQITAVLHLAQPDVFLRGGKMWRENMAIERKVDAFIESLRREELRERECGAEFGRFVKQFEDFSLALGGDENDSDLAAKEVGSANLIDHDLDTLIAALGYAKQQLAQLYADDDIEWDMGTRNIETDVFDPMQELITRIRSTKVPTRKVLRRLLSLAENDEAVRMEAIIHLPPLGRLTSQLVTFATTLSKSIAGLVAEVRSSKMPFEMARMVELVNEATEEGLGETGSDLWSGPLSSTSHVSVTIQQVLTAIVEQDNVIKLSGVGPWLARSEEIKIQATHNPELERQVTKLGEDARDLLRQVKARDQALQEGEIKIERLQKQLETSKAQTDEHKEVRGTLVDIQKQAKAYQEANDALQSELESLQKNNDDLKQQLAISNADTAGSLTNGVDGKAAVNTASGALSAGEELVGTKYASLETSYLMDQVEALRSALRHLRHENACLKSQDLFNQLRAMPALAPHHLIPADVSGAQARSTSGDESDTKVGEPVAKSTSSPPKPATVQTEAKRLVSSALATLALPKVIDLSLVSRTDTTNLNSAGQADLKQSQVISRPWIPYHKQPAVQFHRQQALQADIYHKLTQFQDRLPGRHSVVLPKIVAL